MNLCLNTDDEFVIDSKYEKELNHKVEVFRNEVGSKKALHITLITVSGLKKNEYSEVVVNVITGEDLFV